MMFIFLPQIENFLHQINSTAGFLPVVGIVKLKDNDFRVRFKCRLSLSDQISLGNSFDVFTSHFHQLQKRYTNICI